MIKFVIIFLSVISAQSESWKFFPHSHYYENKYYLITNSLLISGDSAYIINRDRDLNIDNDTFYLLVNINNFSHSFLTKNEIRKLIYNSEFCDTLEDFYLYSGLNNNTIWVKSTDYLFNIKDGNITIYDSVYNQKFNNFYKIRSISDFKINRNNEIWAVLSHDANNNYYYNCKSASRLINDKFVAIDYPTSYSKYVGTIAIAFDNNYNVYHTNVDTLFIINNDTIKKEICIQEFPDGIGDFMKLKISKQNKIYCLSSIMLLHTIDGEKMTTDTFVRHQERLINPNDDLGTGFLMCIDSSDNLWLTSRDHYNLYRLDTTGNWTIFQVPCPPEPPPYEDLCDKTCMEADRYGRIWIAGSKGLYIFDPNGTSPVEEPPQKIESGALPDVWLYNLYPNPADGSTTIEFFLARAQKQTLNASVCSILGERTLNITPLLEYDDYNQRGKITFSTDGLAGGAYFVLVSAGDTKKLTLLMVAK
jgi:hypothetical protein